MKHILRLHRRLGFLRHALLLRLISRLRIIIVLLPLRLLVNRFRLSVIGFPLLIDRFRLEAAVISSLLLIGKGLVKHLELHGLHHILAFPKPQDQFVTLLYALGGQSHPVI